MRIKFTADGDPTKGGTPLLVHNERLADPLDSFKRQIDVLTGKRRKTDDNHREIARYEFLGGLYTDPPLEVGEGGAVHINGARPVVPAWNLLRCLQDGAKRQKRGVDVPRGVYPLPAEPFAVIEYDGPENPQELWEHGGFALRKTVGVQRARTMRTRALFPVWLAAIHFEVDPAIFDADTLAAAWRDAGRYVGLAEMRPVYGRFYGTVEVVEP